uniref:Uncharacterized protein n=1 Tax=Dromaius novaehollandiae TaxID=8790 RepID=A0A8C4P4C2_DRONO
SSMERTRLREAGLKTAKRLGRRPEAFRRGEERPRLAEEHLASRHGQAPAPSAPGARQARSCSARPAGDSSPSTARGKGAKLPGDNWGLIISG